MTYGGFNAFLVQSCSPSQLRSQCFLRTAPVILGCTFLKQAIRAIIVESMDLKKKFQQSINQGHESDNDGGGRNFNFQAFPADQNVFVIVQEYCRLSKLINPSEQDLSRLEAILELAQYDSELSCLINEADHLVAYELELSEDVLSSTSLRSKREISYYSQLALGITAVLIMEFNWLFADNYLWAS